MEKLVKKEILTQDRTGDKKTGAFMYFSVISREQMTLSLLNSVSHQVFGKPLDEGITMLRGGKVDSEAMGKLKEMVAQEEYVEA